MIRTIAAKELVEIRRDGRFLMAALLVVVLLVMAFAIGAQRFVEDRALRTAASAEGRAQWLTQGAKGPHTAAHYGVYAFKPATPLALFDPGYNDYTGGIQYLEAHRENIAGFRAVADGAAIQRFGDLSGANVLQMLVPLLIILLCFALIAGEREEGTWRQLLSIGVKRRDLLLGKLLGATSALVLVLAPPLLVGGVAAAMLVGTVGDHGEQLGARVLLMLLGYVLFFAVILCLSLAVSARARSVSLAFTLLIGFWVVTALLVPRLAADISQRIAPTPSALEVNAAIDAGRNAGPHAHEPHHPNYLRFRDEMLARYKVDDIQKLPVSFSGLALQRDEEVGFAVFDRELGRVRRTYERQDGIHQAFAFLSPFVAIRALSAALAGSDVTFANRFAQAGEAYRRRMVTILNQDLMEKAAGVSSYSADWGYRADARLWRKVPPFDFDPPPLSDVIGRCVTPFLILLGWLAAAGAALWLSVRSTPVDR